MAFCFRDYDSSKNELHIGITDCKGDVYHYDQWGLHCDSDPQATFWTDCLAIRCLELGVVDDVSTSFVDSVNCSEWTASSYHRDAHNCYDFVVAVLRVVDRSSAGQDAWTRDLVCRHLLPHTKRVAQYVSAMRGAQELGITPVKTSIEGP